jgi:hypothetical protein
MMRDRIVGTPSDGGRQDNFYEMSGEVPNMQECPKCHMNVIPMVDGKCPSCRTWSFSAESPDMTVSNPLTGPSQINDSLSPTCGCDHSKTTNPVSAPSENQDLPGDLQRAAIYRLLFIASIVFGLLWLTSGFFTLLWGGGPTATGALIGLAGLAIVAGAVIGLAGASISRWILVTAVSVAAISGFTNSLGFNFLDFIPPQQLVDWARLVFGFARNEIFPLLTIVVVLTTPWPRLAKQTGGTEGVIPPWLSAARVLTIAALLIGASYAVIAVGILIAGVGGSAPIVRGLFIVFQAAAAIALALGAILMRSRARTARLIIIAAIGCFGLFQLLESLMSSSHLLYMGVEFFWTYSISPSMYMAAIAVFSIILLIRHDLYGKVKGSINPVAVTGGTDPGRENSVRHRRLVIVAICVFLLGLWFCPGQYDTMVHSNLHPDMSRHDVWEALGESCTAADNWAIYPIKGDDNMLMVVFNEPRSGGTISECCILEGPPKDGYTEYKVIKSWHCYPGGLAAGKTFLSAITTTIYKYDVRGNPSPWTHNR